MVQIADTQERWSTHSLTRSHLAEFAMVDGRTDGRTDGWMDATDREEKRRGTTSDDGRTRTSPRSITLNGTVVAVDGRHNDDGRSSRDAPSHPTTKLRFTSDKDRPLTNALSYKS